MDCPRKIRRKKPSEVPSPSDSDANDSSFVPLRSSIPVGHDGLDGYQIEDRTLLDPRSSVDSDFNLSYPSNEPSLLEQLREGLAQGSSGHRKLLMGQRHRSSSMTINFTLTSSPGSLESSLASLPLPPARRPLLTRRNRNDMTVKFSLDDTDSSVDNQENESPVLPKAKDVFKRPKAKKMSVHVEDVSDSDSSKVNDDSLPILDSKSKPASLSSTKRLRSAVRKDMTIDFSVDSFDSSDRSITQTSVDGENTAAEESDKHKERSVSTCVPVDAPRDLLQNNDKTSVVGREDQTQPVATLEAPLNPSCDRPESLNDHTFVVGENPPGTQEQGKQFLSSSAINNSVPIDATFTVAQHSPNNACAPRDSPQLLTALVDEGINRPGQESVNLPASKSPASPILEIQGEDELSSACSDDAQSSEKTCSNVSTKKLAPIVQMENTDSPNPKNSELSSNHASTSKLDEIPLKMLRSNKLRRGINKLSVDFTLSDTVSTDSNASPQISQHVERLTAKRCSKISIPFKTYDATNRSPDDSSDEKCGVEIPQATTSCNVDGDQRNVDDVMSPSAPLVSSESREATDDAIRTPLISNKLVRPLTRNRLQSKISIPFRGDDTVVDGSSNASDGNAQGSVAMFAGSSAHSTSICAVNESGNTSVLLPAAVNPLAKRSLRRNKMSIPFKVGDDSSVHETSNDEVSDGIAVSEVDNNERSENIDEFAESSEHRTSISAVKGNGNTSVLLPAAVNPLAKRSLRRNKMSIPFKVGDDSSVHETSSDEVSDEFVASEVDNNERSENIGVNSEESNNQSSKIYEPDTTTEVSHAPDALSLECSMDDMPRSSNDYSSDQVKISERPHENTKQSEKISLTTGDLSGLHLSLAESLQYSNISSSNISIAEAVGTEATETNIISEVSSGTTVHSHSSVSQSDEQVAQVHADAVSNAVGIDSDVPTVQQPPVLRRSKRSKNITADSLLSEDVSRGSKKPYQNPLMKKSGPRKVSIAFTVSDKTIDSSNVTPELHLAIDSMEDRDERQETVPQMDRTPEVKESDGAGETSQTAENCVANRSRRCSKNVTAVKDSSAAKESNVSSCQRQRVVAPASHGIFETLEDPLQNNKKLEIDSSLKNEAGSTSNIPPISLEIEAESHSDKNSNCSSSITSKTHSTPMLRRSKRGTKNMSAQIEDLHLAVSSGNESLDEANANQVQPSNDGKTCGAEAESCNEPSENQLRSRGQTIEEKSFSSAAIVNADSLAVPNTLRSPVPITISCPNSDVAEPGISTSCEPDGDNIVPAPYAFSDGKAASGTISYAQSAKSLLPTSSLQLHVTTMNTECDTDMGMKSRTSAIFSTQLVSHSEKRAQDVTVVSTGAKMTSSREDKNQPTISGTATEQEALPSEMENILASVVPVPNAELPNDEGLLNPRASSSKAATEPVGELVSAQRELVLKPNSQSKPQDIPVVGNPPDSRVTRKSVRKSVSFKPPTEYVYHSPPDHSAIEDPDQKAADGKTILENGYEFSKIQMTTDISDIQSSPGNKKSKRHYSSTPISKRKRIISPTRDVEKGAHQFLIPPAAPAPPVSKRVSILPLPEIISPLNIIPEVPVPVDEDGQSSSQSGKSLDLSCENSLEISAIPKDTTGPKWGNVFHSTPLHRTKAGSRKLRKRTEPPVEPLLEEAPVAEEQAKVNHSVQTSRNLRSRSKTSLESDDASNGSSSSASSKQSLPQSARRNQTADSVMAPALTSGGDEPAGSPADRISIQDNTVLSTRIESQSRTRGSKSRSTTGSGFKSYDSHRKMTSRRLFNDNGNDDGNESPTPSNETSCPRSNAASTSLQGDLLSAPETSIPRSEQLSMPRTDENVSLIPGQDLDDSDNESVVSAGSCASTESRSSADSHVVMRQSFQSEVSSLRRRPKHRRGKVDCHRENAPKPVSKHRLPLPEHLDLMSLVPTKKRKRNPSIKLFNPGPKWKKSKHLYAWLKLKLQPKYGLYTNQKSELLVIELNNSLILVRQGYKNNALGKSVEMLQDLGLCCTQIQLWSLFMKFMPLDFVQAVVPMGGAFGKPAARTAFRPYDPI